MIRLQQPTRLRGRGAGILDRLRLVENHVVEAARAEAGDIAAQRAVGRDRQVRVDGIDILHRPFGVTEIVHLELRREAGGFAYPVKHERTRDHQQRHADAFFASRFEHGQHLDRLAQTHVVGQTSAQCEATQEAEPRQPLFLIAAQRAHEALRHRDSVDPLELLELRTTRGERFVHIDIRQGGQQHVEQRELRRPEPDAITTTYADRQERAQFVERFIRKKTDHTVAELDEVRAFVHRREQLRQRELMVAIPQRPREIKPIDSRAHTYLQRTRRHERRAIGLDQPAIAHERGDQPR